MVSVGIFSVEYVLRLYACTADPRCRHPVKGRLRFAITPLVLVDLFAVLPFYVSAINADLRFLRMLRAIRIIRLAKIARYSEAVRTLGRVLNSKKEELAISLGLLTLLLILVSALMYYAEHDVQPDKFSSIPAAFWCAIATLSTVGYGDVYPITPLGKIVGAGAAVLGIGMFALPTGILGAGFLLEIQKGKQAPQRCPHCGNTIE